MKRVLIVLGVVNLVVIPMLVTVNLRLHAELRALNEAITNENSRRETFTRVFCGERLR